MIEWLLSPIDPERVHAVDFYIAWHARFMVLAWGVLFPLGVIIARFFKITVKQNWPEQLDNQFWWNWHLRLQYTAAVLMLLALALILIPDSSGFFNNNHTILGWLMIGLTVLQFVAGWLRGSKGGPTQPASDGSLAGDHYDMTLHRKVFEYFHKSMGYLLLGLAAGTMVSGLWYANAPVWMWLVLPGWWILLIAVFVYLQTKGYAVDTYQAIWGPDNVHPGNSLKPIGFGVRRLK